MPATTKPPENRGLSPTTTDGASIIARNLDPAPICGGGQPFLQVFLPVGGVWFDRRDRRGVKISLTPRAVLASVTLPSVMIAFYPPVGVPIGVLVVIIVGVVVWHLRRGGRATLRRSQKGCLSLTLDSSRKHR
jgi:hypothetical protein